MGKILSSIKSKIKNFQTNKILLYYLLFLLLSFTIIFEYLVFTWADNPIQKVVWAPLGEESLKLFTALFLCLLLIYLLEKNFTLSKIFTYSFVPSAIIVGIIFGMNESTFNSIILHFSTTTIGAILFFLTFKLTCNWEQNPVYKLSMIFPTIIVPIFFHSVSNQYANISVAEKHIEFESFVLIARILIDQTKLSNQIIFKQVLLIMTVMFLITFLLKFIFLPFITKYIEDKDKRRILKTVGTTTAFIPLAIGIGCFSGKIILFSSDTLFWLSIALIQAFAALLALIIAIIVYNLKVIKQSYKSSREEEEKSKSAKKLDNSIINLHARIYPYVVSAILTIITSIFFLTINKARVINSNMTILHNYHISIGITFLSLLSFYTLYLFIRQINAVLTLEA